MLSVSANFEAFQNIFLQYPNNAEFFVTLLLFGFFSTFKEYSTVQWNETKIFENGFFKIGCAKSLPWTLSHPILRY